MTLLSVREVAAMLGVCEQTIRNRMAAGDLARPLTVERVWAAYSSWPIAITEAAAICGVTPKTFYRWLDEGRICCPLTRRSVLAQRPTVRPRGPRRNPRSVRYTRGRHSFDEVRSTRV